MAKPRRLFRVAGIENAWGVHNADVATVHRAIITRVMEPKDAAPVPDAWSRYSWVQDEIAEFLGSGTVKLTYAQVAARYSGRRRRVILRTIASLQLLPLMDRDARIALFPKLEKVNFLLKADPDPRAILPRKSRFNVELARYLFPIEKRIYRALDHAFRSPVPSIAKGHNFEQRARHLRAKWDRFRDPVCTKIDASRWDQHVTCDALRFEHGVYNRAYRDPFLATILSKQEINVFMALVRDGWVRGRRRGFRASGDQNTGLGNVLLACTPILAIVRAVPYLVEVYDDGDDCVLMCERSQLADLRARLLRAFTDIGQVLKFESEATVFEKIVFCQTQPVWTDEGWVMCRDPRVAISKDLCTTLDIRRLDTFRQYCATIGDCGIAVAGGVPVFNAFYLHLRRIGGHGKRLWDQPLFDSWGVMHMAKSMRRRPAEPSTAARLSFGVAFDMSPGMQRSLERYLEAVVKFRPFRTSDLRAGGRCI